MKNISKLTLASALVLGVAVATTSSAAAFGGDGQGEGMGEGKRGQGMHQGQGEGKGEGRFHLMPEEMHEQFRAEHENLSDEERTQLREERRAQRDEKHAEMEAFTGISHDEMREAHKNGEDIGNLLTENGVTQESAEVFFTENANEHVSEIAERHSLDESQIATIQARVSEFVQSRLAQWFN